MENKKQLRLVWEKAKSLQNYDSDCIRKDKCGAWINFDKYGDRTSEYGWEIDHIIPKSKGGMTVSANRYHCSA